MPGYMTDGDRAEENALIQDHGHRLFERYMEILMEGPEVFLLTAKNFAPAGKAHDMFFSRCTKETRVLFSTFSILSSVSLFC